MRWFALLVLLLATVAIHCDDEVEATEAVEEGSGESEETPKQEEVDNWEDDGVMVLSADNFEEFIKENEFVLVEFYAPWCGHCKSFAPEYVKIATQLEEQSSPIKVVKVDATKDSKYTADYGVRGYPTLKLFRRGLQSHTDFWGPKDVDKILSWLNKKTGPPAVDIKNVEAAEELIKSQNVAILGFFDDYESEEAKAFLKAADAVDDYRSGITKNPEVYKKYEAESGSIILLKNFDEGKAVFDGEYTEQEIQKFIAVYAAPIIIDFNTKFTHIIFSVVRSHVLLFISKEDGHWEDLIQPLKAVAEHYRGEIVFIAIDADVSDHQRILDFFYITDTSIPTLRFVHFADGNNNKYKMKNDDLSPESVKAFIEDGIAGKLRVEVKSEKIPEDWDKAPVKVLVGDNFEDVALDVTKDVFVSFYSPWSEDSKKLAPIIDELGEKYKDSETVVIAKFDAASNELDPKYPKIDTYPTLRLYQKGDNEVSYYTGQLSVEAFVKFIESGGEEITPIDIKETDDNTEDEDKSEDEDKAEDVEEEEEAEEVEYTFEDDEQSEGKDEL